MRIGVSDNSSHGNGTALIAKVFADVEAAIVTDMASLAGDEQEMLRSTVFGAARIKPV